MNKQKTIRYIGSELKNNTTATDEGLFNHLAEQTDLKESFLKQIVYNLRSKALRKPLEFNLLDYVNFSDNKFKRVKNE